jgi:CubicO group peptidase (beta-lactamase class C family)
LNDDTDRKAPAAVGLRLLLLFAVMCVTWASGASAQPSRVQAGSAEGVQILDRPDAEAWLDGFLPSALKAQDIAGGVVVIVKDGQVLVSKGYGFADVARRVPVDPRVTLFRPGSISKLFTWTAVMQLVEQRKIDLDADINTYLDFRVTGRGGSPITTRHLLTHRAGFEEGIKDLILFERNPDLAARKFLARWVPDPIYTPGQVPAYSNYGAGLAGYIVERVSGLAFEDYVQRNIFNPLAMKNATFRQPLPGAMRPSMSQAYLSAAGPAQPFEYVSIPAAGALSITGDDMARFMIAHLQNGRAGSAQILNRETAVLMHDHAMPFMADLDPFLLGFYATNINNRRVISHGGNTVFFHSYVRLFIDDGVGIYLSLNSTGKDYAQLQQSIFESFADRYFPSKAQVAPVSKDAARDAAAVAGQYMSTRRSASNFLSIASLIAPMTITANADDSITVNDGKPVRYVHVGPLRWQTRDGKLHFGAAEKDGAIRWTAGGEAAAVQAWEPFQASQSPQIWMPLGKLSLTIIALIALAWPVGRVMRWHFGKPFPLSGKARLAFWISRLAAFSTLIVVISWLVVLSSLETLNFPSDALLLTLQGGLLAALLALFFSAIWSARTAFAQKARLATMSGGLLALCALPLMWVAFAYHFFAFTTNY